MDQNTENQNDKKLGFKREMTEEEKYLCSQNYRDVNQEKIFLAEKRGCELADQFANLEVQIAIILFGLMSLFPSSSLGSGIGSWSLGLKLSYVSIFFLLMTSLIFGLIHIKIREFFWEGHSKVRASRFVKWDAAVKRKINYEDAMSFHEGTSHGKMDTISKSQSWPWILQTICLAIAFIGLFVIMTVLLFSIK